MLTQTGRHEGTPIMLFPDPPREQNKAQRIGCTPRNGRGKMPGMISRLLSPAAEPGHASQKFEDLLVRLEQIVSDMENGEMPLEKLLASYEEGMKLVKSCGDRLTDAEQKVEILSKAAEPAKVAASASAEPAAETSPTQAEDEIRLF